MIKIEDIGLKPGSQNTAVASRNESKIVTNVIKTCIRYPRNSLLNQTAALKPMVGDEAANFADAKYPLNLGLVETQEGTQQIMEIFKCLEIPQGSDIVVASPAMEINEGQMRLADAVKEVFHPNKLYLVSEALCSNIYLLMNQGIIQNPNDLLSKTILSANLGSSTFEFGCFDQTDTVHLSAHSEAGGNIVDEKIFTRIQSSLGDAFITLPDIRAMKESCSLTEIRQFEVKGQNRDGIVVKMVSKEVTEPVMDYVNIVAEIIKKELKSISPQIRRSAFEMPLAISGGMANIEGLPELLTEALEIKLNYPIKTIYSKEKNSHMTAAIGALMLCEVTE